MPNGHYFYIQIYKKYNIITNLFLYKNVLKFIVLWRLYFRVNFFLKKCSLFRTLYRCQKNMFNIIIAKSMPKRKKYTIYY